MSTPFPKLLEGLVQIDDQRWTLVTKQEVCLGRRLCPALWWAFHIEMVYVYTYFSPIFLTSDFVIGFGFRFRLFLPNILCFLLIQQQWLSPRWVSNCVLGLRLEGKSSEEMDLPSSRRIYWDQPPCISSVIVLLCHCVYIWHATCGDVVFCFMWHTGANRSVVTAMSVMHGGWRPMGTSPPHASILMQVRGFRCMIGMFLFDMPTNL